MDRKRLLTGLVFAFFAAFLLAAFVYHEIKRASTPAPASMKQIVVASGPLPLGTRLTSRNCAPFPGPRPPRRS